MVGEKSLLAGNGAKKWDISDEIKNRIKAMNRVIKNGGNMFEALAARLTDVKTGKYIEDIVIYAIRIIKSPEEAKSFFDGYVKDIEEHPKKYPKKAAKKALEFARSDILLVLGLHFRNPMTHRRWGKIVKTDENPKGDIKT